MAKTIVPYGLIITFCVVSLPRIEAEIERASEPDTGAKLDRWPHSACLTSSKYIVFGSYYFMVHGYLSFDLPDNIESPIDKIIKLQRK